MSGSNREELHRLLDLILDGPGSNADVAALQALVSIGRIVGVARWAIDHEARRILAGCERSSGSVVLVDERLPEDARRELAKNFGDFKAPKTVRQWEKLVGAKGTPEQKRALMRVLLEAIDQGAGDRRFKEFADALDALDQGETLSLLRPSRSKTGRGGHGATFQITKHRLRAVLGIEYQRHTGAYRSAAAARNVIAELYGVKPKTMEKWPELVAKGWGARRMEQEVVMAALSGLIVNFAKAGEWRPPPGFFERGERSFGLAALKRDGERYMELQRTIQSEPPT